MKNILGLKLKPGLEGTSNTLSSYVCAAKDPFYLYKDEPWFESVRNRTLYEENKLDYKQSGFDFIPPTTESCSPKNYRSFGTNCTLGLYDTTAQPSITILNETYSTWETTRLFAQWNTSVNSAKFNEHTNDLEFLKFKNPGVAVSIFMLRSLPTLKTLVYKANITQYIERNEFYYPEETNGLGDGSVPTFSQLVPILKWAWEFDQKNVSEAKPVKIIDFCSEYKQRVTPYDSVDENGVGQITKNEFFGSNCDCMKQISSEGSAHAEMINDQHYLNMFENVLISGESSLTEQHTKFINELEQSYLIKVSEECPTVRF